MIDFVRVGWQGAAMTEQPPVVRIGNASGFYGDRFAAVREMLEGGPLDVLTGDYLAELTMLILGRGKLKDPTGGYATTFLRQMEESLGLAADRGVKIVSNAGGLNPAGLAVKLRELTEKLGLGLRIAHVEGDDLLPRADELTLVPSRAADRPQDDGRAQRAHRSQEAGGGPLTGPGRSGGGRLAELRPLTANAYLGAWGIAECLAAGADVVVTGRVTDASLVVGPAAAYFGWARDDWDALAAATVAGHVLECGAQATGGNYAFFQEIGDARHLGFPIAEIRADGSSVITKHERTGGAVTVETVTAQLLYEIGGPRYAGPDVTTRFDTIAIEQEGKDRVRISGVQGEPPPETLKVCLNHLGGFRNEMTFVLTGLDIDAKAALVRAQVEDALQDRRPERTEWTLIGDPAPDPDSQGAASCLLRCAVKDPEETKVGRAFSNAAVELALAGYPGFTMTSPPGKATPYGVYTAAYVEASDVEHTAVLPDGTRRRIEPASSRNTTKATPGATLPDPYRTGPTVQAPLGRIAGARSGDKGGDANIGVWARTEPQYRWLARFLTTERLRELLPETQDHDMERHVLPNLNAINFVVHGLLQDGVSASTRFDPQGKALGEWLRARQVDIPEAIL
jgi:acyclic terpene utilization AtuA family protein